MLRTNKNNDVVLIIITESKMGIFSGSNVVLNILLGDQT